MIISEKQIMQLMIVAHEYRRDLLKQEKLLTPTGLKALDDTSSLLTEITNQQPAELKMIE